jgi:hypothetical protein
MRTQLLTALHCRPATVRQGKRIVKKIGIASFVLFALSGIQSVPAQETDVTYLPGNNMQFDVYLGTGLDDRADDLIGWGVRFLSDG